MENKREVLISVIVPAFQGENTIERCVNSILLSSLKDLEVIVVDDGSTDKTSEIVEKIARKDERVLLITKENEGVSRARNEGLRQARGVYVGFVDADDFVDRSMYEILAGQLSDSCDMVICGSYYCNAEGEIIEKKLRPIREYQRKCPLEALQTVIYDKTTMAVWSKLFKSSKIKNEDGSLKIKFHEDQCRYEDFIFICDYLSECSGEIKQLSRRLYYYTRSEGGLSHQPYTAVMMKQNLQPILNLKKKITDTSFTAPELFYTENFVKQWYIQGMEYSRKELTQRTEDRTLLAEEAGRYLKVYLRSPKVHILKKAAAWLMVKHSSVATVLMRALRRVVSN